MTKNERNRRSAVRARMLEIRAARKAEKAVASNEPQSAKTHLIAAGLDLATANRFASAFSRGMMADALAETSIKLKGRATKRVPVKLYRAESFQARLSTYRPKDKAAATQFERIAA